MGKILSSCPNLKNSIKSLRYTFFSFLIAAGFITIIATGGGGDGDGGDGGGDPCDYNADIDCDDGGDKYCIANTGDPANFTVFNDKLIFTAFSGCINTVSTVLFELDNPRAINEIYEISSVDLNEFASYPMRIRSLVIVNNVAYFTGMTDLHKYDGVNPVQKIAEGISSDSLMAYNDKLYYTAFKASSGPPGPGGFTVDLYSYDGSNSVLIGEISGYLGGYTVYNGKLYFFVNEDLWCYNENTAVLSLVSDMGTSLTGTGFLFTV